MKRKKLLRKLALKNDLKHSINYDVNLGKSYIQSKHTMPAWLDWLLCQYLNVFVFFFFLNLWTSKLSQNIVCICRTSQLYCMLWISSVSNGNMFYFSLALSLSLVLRPLLRWLWMCPKNQTQMTKPSSKRGEAIKSVKNESNDWSYNQKRKKIHS